MNNFIALFRRNRASIAQVLVLCLILNASTSTLLAVTQNSYTQLAEQHLPSLAKQEMAEQKKYQEIKEYNKNLKPKDVKNIKVGEFGEVEKLKMLYEIMSLDSTEARKPEFDILSKETLDDLETFCGDKTTPERHLFAALDNTQTAMGKIELQRMIFESTTDVSVLKKRQAFIKALLEDELLFNQLDDLVATTKQSETNFVWFWKNLEDETKKYFDQVYFGKKYFMDFSGFNKDEVKLEASTLWNTVGSPLYWTTLPLLMNFSLYVFIKWLIKNRLRINIDEFPYGKFLKDTTKHTFNLIAKGKTTETDFITGKKVTSTIDNESRIYLGVTVAIGLLFWFTKVKNSVSNAINFNNVSNDIQKRMISASTLTISMEHIAHIITHNQTLKTCLADGENTAQKITPAADRFAKSLHASSFRGEPSFFSDKGKVLAAFNKIHDVKNGFVGLMKTAGQVDALLSIAKLFKKHANNDNGTYCFVDYVTGSSTPYINLKNYWHPILNANSVVTNNLELGGSNNASHVVVTGPNAGGKSTNLKGVTIAIMLAQSFGIAPARSMQLTPFALINTYMNIADAEGKESLFQAEMHRAQELLRQVRSLKSNELSFVVMDEIFTGTNPKEGMAAAYGIAKKLSTHTNNMSIIASHFMLMTELAEDTNGKFVNKRVYVNKHANGSFTFPYKLEDGITNQAIALDLLQQEGFDDDILKDAFDVIDRKRRKRNEK